MKTIGFWLIVIGCVLTGQIMMGGQISTVIQFTSGLFIYGPIAGYCLLIVGGRQTVLLFKNVLSLKLNEDQCEQIYKITSLGYLMGTIAAILGLIHVFESLADTSKLGSGIAVMCLGLLYGCLPGVFLLPLAKANSAKAAATSHHASARYAAAAVLICLVSVTAVLYATKAG